MYRTSLQHQLSQYSSGVQHSLSLITQADTLTEIISLGGSIREETDAGSLARTGAQILRQIDPDLELDKYFFKIIFQAR